MWFAMHTSWPHARASYCGRSALAHRRYARIWATPELARLLEPRAVNQRLRRVQEAAPARPQAGAGRSDRAPASADPGSVARDWDERKVKSEARLERIY
jgi:hypothetical protein